MTRPYHRMCEEDWIEILNDWLDWARTKTNPETNIGQFGFASRDQAPNLRFASRVCTLLQGMGFVRQAPGFSRRAPRWWVKPDGKVTLEDLKISRAKL